jgi:hypothetical protein
MPESPLAAWENFYIIVGTSAGALTGLLFVVITLLAERRLAGASSAIGAFTTPTVVHFCAVLGVAALLSVPWPALAPPALLLGLAGLGGVAYTGVVMGRMRRRIGYAPAGDDWLWYAALPLVVYAALLVAALLLPGRPALVLFGIGALQLLLLFVGIRNAWDEVTYVAVDLAPQQQVEDDVDDKRDGEDEGKGGTP